MSTDASQMDMARPEPDGHTKHDGHGGMDMTGTSDTSATMASGVSMDMSGGPMAGMQSPPWAHGVAIVLLGIWLITNPFALTYGNTVLNTSDVISGMIMVALAVVALVRRSMWAPWANSLVGVWLLFAPLVFTAPTAAAFANDTLAGALVITFAILMPGMPGMRMIDGPEVPKGWSYNPSSWPQRAPIIALAFLAFFLSRQMSAFQLGYTHSVWEPFFNPGTKGVLNSTVSRSLPISDAGVGAVAYILEGLMGFMGDKQRWRTMPWMVTFFGILVVPLGVASITLIILQPLSVGTWCTPCLVAALAMLIMIALTLDEVVAMIQFLIQAHREGQPLWKIFWLGGALKETSTDTLPVHPDVLTGSAMGWGVTLPWTLVVTTVLGLWLMASPAVLHTSGNVADSDHLVGALVITVAVIAFAEVGRTARFINIGFGAWLIAAPWLLNGGTAASKWTGITVGLLLIMATVRRGPINERYGTYDRAIR